MKKSTRSTSFDGSNSPRAIFKRIMPAPPEEVLSDKIDDVVMLPQAVLPKVVVLSEDASHEEKKDDGAH